MTDKQVLKMYNALATIAKEYCTIEQLQRAGKKNDFGPDYHETLEMAYENIQNTAKEAIKGVRIKDFIKAKFPTNQ